MVLMILASLECQFRKTSYNALLQHLMIFTTYHVVYNIRIGSLAGGSWQDEFCQYISASGDHSTLMWTQEEYLRMVGKKPGFPPLIQSSYSLSLYIYIPNCWVLIFTGRPVSELDFFAPPYSPPHWSCHPPPVVSSCSRCNTWKSTTPDTHTHTQSHHSKLEETYCMYQGVIRVVFASCLPQSCHDNSSQNTTST